MKYILLAVAVYYIWKWLKRSHIAHLQKVAQTTDATVKELVKCQKCGVYVEKDLARETSGNYICKNH